jgi:prephenate dehydrogenase
MAQASMPQFNQITIVGLGLMGGSLGMALRRRGLAREVVGLSRSRTTIRQAARRRAIDWGTTDPREALRNADLVVLATPVDTIVPYAKRLARSMKAGGILTDVGSTKAQIVTALEWSLPKRVAFVGGHPIAGSEQRGLEAARADLFDGSDCVLTPTSRTSRRALAVVRRLWRGLGCDVMTMSPRQHDHLLARTSHLPHLLAYCLSLTEPPGLRAHTPRSVLDMTRIAKSDPDLWDDIFLSNRGEVLAAAGRFEGQWKSLRAAIVRCDRAALRRLLAAAKTKRDALEG